MRSREISVVAEASIQSAFLQAHSFGKHWPKDQIVIFVFSGRVDKSIGDAIKHVEVVGNLIIGTS